MKSRQVFLDFVENYYYFQKSRKGYDRSKMLNSHKLACEDGWEMAELDKATDTITKLIRRQ